MAVLTTVNALQAHRVVGGYDIPHDSSNQEAATQTYKAGAVLIFSSGTLTEAGANPTGIVGIAENDGQNLAAAGFYPKESPGVAGVGAQGPLVALALPSVVFEGNLAGTTAGDPDQTHTLAITDVGLKFGIAKGTTSKLWYVNFSDTTNTRVVVVGLRDPVGTIGGRVYFMFEVFGTGTGTGVTIYS